MKVLPPAAAVTQHHPALGFGGCCRPLLMLKQPVASNPKCAKLSLNHSAWGRGAPPTLAAPPGSSLPASL